MDPITFSIGPREYRADPMPFLLLEQAWPHIKQLNAAADVVEETAASLAIVAVALSLNQEQADRPSVPELKRMLTAAQVRPLNAAVGELIRASMPPAPPELSQGEVVASSTATSDPSSPNSPPEASAGDRSAP